MRRVRILVLAIVFVAVWEGGGLLALSPAVARAGAPDGAESAVTTVALNLRAGPSTADHVILVMRPQAPVTLTGQTSNGFLSVDYAGHNGWADTDYVRIEQARRTAADLATTTANLNLRSRPSTSSAVDTVIPVGAMVWLTGQVSNGFCAAQYDGVAGWASSTYLATTPGTSPDGGGSTGSVPVRVATTTDAVNLRAGPSISTNVQTVMTSGDRIVESGQSRNGFDSVIADGEHGWIAAAYLLASAGAPGQAITQNQGTSGRKEVALTFDAGADAGYAAQILDLLKQKGIKATFGVAGKWVEQNPVLARRMAAEGHMLINHTYDHQSFTGRSTGAVPLTSAQRIDEILHAEQVIRDTTGAETAPYFRFPYGDGNVDQQSLTDVATAGYTHNVGWTCDSMGWAGWSVDSIVQRCGHALAAPGEIILQHVGFKNDYLALPGLIQALSDQGYTFVTIDQLLAP